LSVSLATFDPASPAAARWRSWMSATLGERGIPSDAMLELQIRPHGEAAIARLWLDLCWAGRDGERHAHAEVLVPLRRVVGVGWAGWPAYLAGLRLLRALG
jgi:hypothetical protein